jgi:hypothetical protein
VLAGLEIERRLAELREQLLSRYPSSSLTALTAADVSAIAARHPGAPSDYLVLLRVLGWGSIGQGAFAIYSSPVPASDIFGPAVAGTMRDIVMVGDDFAGGHAAYSADSGQWRFVSIEHARPTEVLAGPWGTFLDYLEDWFRHM